MKRLLLFLLAAGIAAFLVKQYGLFSPATPEAPRGDPLARARAAAAAGNARTSAGEALARETDRPGSGAVSENMSPEQVRMLLGSPDDVQSETLENGSMRETWTYRSVGKTVVFENGVAVSVR